MKIIITMHYLTSWREKIVLRIGDRRREMESSPQGLWRAELQEGDFADGCKYGFEVVRDGVTVRREWRGHRFVRPSGAAPEVMEIRDRWTDRPAGSAFWSSAFTDVIFKRPSGRKADPGKYRGAGNVTFVVTAPEVRPDQAVAIAGSGRTLGDWQKVTLLDDSRFPLWDVTLNMKDAAEYKFVIVDRKTLRHILWEEGPNHVLPEIPEKGRRLVLADSWHVFRTVPWRGAGTAVPVFSLRTEDSFGVGEFNDIKKLVDWAAATGQNVIQLLPVNDTAMTGTWQDSYPYNANSSFALHPQFIHLPDAGVRAGKDYRTLRDELNALPAEDYERVNREKMRLLRIAFDERKEDVAASPDYMDFVNRNAFWLKPYAVFCALRDEFGTADFSKWGKYAKYGSGAAADAYARAHKDEIAFHCYVQYCLDQQLKDAVKYAHNHGVALKGDLPIGVSRTSADAWTNPELFHLDSQAGAPPDAFSADGQNWGFPTYNWEEMARTGFAWWKARLRKMNEYFDAFRIDHILGFFRIWEIPCQYKSGLMGHFSPALPYSSGELAGMGFDMKDPRYTRPGGKGESDVLFLEDPRRKGFWHPRIAARDTTAYAALDEGAKRAFDNLYDDFFYRRHNVFWKDSAYAKLPDLLRATGMLACGEDLGMIPACVPDTMNDLNILSLEIQRMPKSLDEEFGRPSSYPYWCVCATGTHDTSTLRAWWEEDRGLSARFYRNVLGCGGDVPYYCEPWLCEMIVEQHMKSPAMLAVLPIQDWLSVDGAVRYGGNPADERINVPAEPRHYWRYRMHCTLESLIANDELNARLRRLISESGRNV